MAILRVVWATHYLRWVAILGTTASAHALAFFIGVAGGGAGSGPAVPEGRVTLHLTQTEPPSLVPVSAVCLKEQPVDARPLPVEVQRSYTPAAPILPTPPTGNLSAHPPASTCLLSQVSRAEARTAPCVREPLRCLGSETRDIDGPIVLSDGSMPPRLLPTPGADASAVGVRSVAGVCAEVAGAASHGSSPGSAASAHTGEGIEPDFVLSGKPVYPLGCRRGDCNGRYPCEGISRWRVTVQAPGGKPSRIERIQSADCERLDASTEAFLREARIPRAGVFLLRFRFKLDGSR